MLLTMMRPDASWRTAAGQMAPVVLVCALTLWLGVSNGGFFPGATGVAAVLACAAVLLTLTLSARPGAGLRPAGIAAIAGIAGLAVWTLASSAWSDAPGRALLEYQRVLLYLGVFAVFASMPGRGRRARALVRGLAVTAVALCAAGLAVRALPGAFDVPAAVIDERLSWPLGYWNAMGLLAALALTCCVQLAADLDEPGAARVLAAAGAPIAAATLLLTLSRGGFWAAAIALAVLLALGRSPGLLTAALAIAPPVAYVLIEGYGAEALLDNYDAASAATRDAGRSVIAMTLVAAAVAAAVRALGLLLDTRMKGRRAPRVGAPARIAAGAAAVVVAVGIAVATDASDRLQERWDRFVAPATFVPNERARLSDVASNFRVEFWRVGWSSWQERPLRGSGAGTFAKTWAAQQPVPLFALDGHSLPLEVLSELGVVGIALLALGLGLPAALMLARRRDPGGRVLWSGALALTAAWAAHACVDWDWEVPALQLGVLALLGTACAREAPREGREGLGRVPRILGGLAVLALAIQPAQIARSQHDIDAAIDAFRAGDCARTADRSLAALDALDTRTEPLELLGYCDVRAGRPKLAVRMLDAALARDPGSWELLYGSAIVHGAAGEDPRPLLAQARRAYPNGRVIQDALERVRGVERLRGWRRAALASELVLPLEVPEDASKAMP